MSGIEHREGIVEVYDWNGKYLGCMGEERWQRLLRDDANTAPWSVRSQPARRDRLVPEMETMSDRFQS